MAQYFLNIYSIPYFISFLVWISIGVFLLFKKSDNKHVQLFIITSISAAIITLSAAMATCSLEPEIWDIWYSINLVTVMLTVTTYYHFSYVSLTKKQVLENKKFLLIYIIPLFFLAFVIINPENIVDKSPESDMGIYGKEYIGPYFFFTLLINIILGLMLFLTTINFILMFRKSKDWTTRRRALFFLLSSFLPFIGFIISVFLVEIFHIIPHMDFGTVFMSLSGALITYSIVKHRLFDIEFIVKRTFIYLIITLILIGIFRSIEMALTYFISFTFFGGELLARLIAGAIVAGIFFPLRGQAIRIGDKLFPKFTKTIKPDYEKNLAIYEKQLEFALEDGKLDKKEKKRLRTLQNDLGITFEDHKSLKRKIHSKIRKK